MKSNREMLEDQLESYSEELKGLTSYVSELKAVTAKLGTDRELFADDLIEAEHNIGFYDGEIAKIKKELSESEEPAPTQTGGTPTSAVRALILSVVAFIGGAVLGSRLNFPKVKENSE